MQNKLYFLIHMVVSLSFIMHVSADEFPKGVVAFGSNTFFVKTDGTFWGTGANSLGQLGNGQTVDSSTFTPAFTQMTGVSDIRGVASSGATTMVVKNDGTVWGVGANYGVLGDGTRTNRENFVQALEKTTDAPITDVQAVSLGSGFAMALKTDGTLWATGSNSKGKLGTNNDGDSSSSDELKFVQPVDSSLALMTDVKVIVGAQNGQFGMAVKTDGTLWAAGFNNYRQLGIGTEDYYVNTYTQAVDESGPITNVQDVSMGYDWAILLKTDGTVWGAGFNSNGQLADETSETRSRFVQAKDASGGYITDVKSISAGTKQSMVLKTDGTVWVTGRCWYGSCGLGSAGSKNSYFQITSLSSDVVLISAGDEHMVAVKADGTLWSTGKNWNGQQGNGEAGNDINVADFTQVAEGVDTKFGIPPKDKLDTPFVFRNDPDQRATCRQITSKSACNDENACSWNVFMGMCNDHGYQPLFAGCHQCLFVAQGPSGNNGHWSADEGITLSDSDATRVVRWEGKTDMETQDLASVDLVAPTGYEAYFAEPNSDTNSHPTYPAVEFRGDGNGNALFSAAKHPSGCGGDWTYVVVVKPTQSGGRRNIFTTYDAPPTRLNQDSGSHYKAFSISVAGLHYWAGSPDWLPGDITANELQVVVYSFENNQILTIGYYQNGQAAREYRKEDMTVTCGSEEFDHGYVVMGRGVQNDGHNYYGLIYEATTYPRAMQNDEIQTVAEALLEKYAE